MNNLAAHIYALDRLRYPMLALPTIPPARSNSEFSNETVE